MLALNADCFLEYLKVKILDSLRSDEIRFFYNVGLLKKLVNIASKVRFLSLG